MSDEQQTATFEQELEQLEVVLAHGAECTTAPGRPAGGGVGYGWCALGQKAPCRVAIRADETGLPDCAPR